MWKFANFPTPCMFNAPAEQVPLEFSNSGIALKKLTVPPLQVGGKSLTICVFVSIQYETVTDRRTDGFAVTISRSACIGMLTRDKSIHSFFVICFFFSFWYGPSKWRRNKLCGRPPQYAPPPCKLTFDLLTLKVVSPSRTTWATSVPILVFLGLSVLDSEPMYVTDRQTSDAHQR